MAASRDLKQCLRTLQLVLAYHALTRGSLQFEGDSERPSRICGGHGSATFPNITETMPLLANSLQCLRILLLYHDDRYCHASRLLLGILHNVRPRTPHVVANHKCLRACVLCHAGLARECDSISTLHVKHGIRAREINVGVQRVLPCQRRTCKVQLEILQMHLFGWSVHALPLTGAVPAAATTTIVTIAIIYACLCSTELSANPLKDDGIVPRRRRSQR
mmetsp:Transcript_1852/g.5098  ORF Transcript_1852/g.5098 Transcript_1852/m.5098 type:complete len:219 (+) Transcript_1852:267-923(+)